MKNPLANLQRALEPQLRIQEQLARALGPQLDLQKQLVKALGPQLDFQKKLAKALGPQLDFQKQLAKALGPQLRLREQLAKALGPQLRLQEQLTIAFGPQLRFQEQLAKAFSPQFLEQEQLTGSLEPRINILNQLERFNCEIESADFASIEMVDKTHIREKENVVNVNDIVEELKVFTSTSLPESQLDIIQILLDWLDKQKNAIKNIALFLIVPYLVAIFANLTTPMFEDWVHEYHSYPLREASKAIVRDANSIYSFEELQEYRFVTVDILHVREDSGTKYAIVDEIYRGKVVRLLGKNKRWCLIEYVSDMSGVLEQGWVYSRHLKKLNK